MKKKQQNQNQILNETLDINDIPSFIFQFNLIDAIQIRQMLFALNSGYEIKHLYSRNGVTEFVLCKKD